MINDNMPDTIEIDAGTLAREIANDPRFEALLREAAEVPVPAGLAERILARHAITASDVREENKVLSFDTAAKRTTQNPHLRPPRWLAMAASVLLIVGLVGIGYLNHDPGAAIGQRIVVALNEPMPRYDRMVVANEVDPNLQENLHTLMQTVGLKKVGDMGTVNYCEVRRINGTTSGVLVVPGSSGAVTVVYLLDERVTERRRIDSPTMEGVIWPDAKGSIAIIGHKGETMIEDVEQRIRRSFQWL